ncbi:protein held out wings isoform X9 [Bombyx mori]|uniref:K Homology domain-containing protein n=1 Tax=Bombyx mori TaxID=7091 RepID=A0A8R2QW77_BOMMO|nr:protein held out wings isoform X8 [Bombyx mori]
MCDNTNPSTQSIADYLAQLLKDRKQLAAFPNVFMHMERLLDEEIAKVRASLFQINGVKKEPLILPEPEGMVTTLTEKVYVPVKEHPDFNFVGRILGPRGMTAKQLEQETGCKIMVRGKGSMRDKKKEDANRGKPNWEHLADDLHVLLTVEDTENRAKIKLARAVDEVKRLLVPQADGEDELKKRQLMELAIINGTYRDSSSKVSVPVNGQCLIRAGAAAGLLSPGEPAHQLIYASPYDYANYAALTAAANPLLATEYAAADHAGVVRRAGRVAMREHPYQRTALPAP